MRPSVFHSIRSTCMLEFLAMRRPRLYRKQHHSRAVVGRCCEGILITERVKKMYAKLY